MIPIPIPIPVGIDSDSDSDSRVSQNDLLIPILIPIPASCASDTNSNSNKPGYDSESDSRIWFRFRNHLQLCLSPIDIMSHHVHESLASSIRPTVDQA